MLKTTCHWCLFSAIRIQLMPYHPISLRSISILSPIYTHVFQRAFIMFSHKNHASISSLLCVPRALLPHLQFDHPYHVWWCVETMILLIMQYSQVICSLYFRVQIFFLAFCSTTHSVFVCNSM